MKRKKLSRAIIRTGSAMIFCSIITGTMWAQGIPSVTNIPNAQYPMVNPDRTVTFKVKAPDAKSVQIVLDRPYEMQKGQDGTWELTSSPQVPGFHYYSVQIGGLQVTDASTYSYFGMSRQASAFEVPEEKVDFYLPQKGVRSGRSQKRQVLQCSLKSQRSNRYCKQSAIMVWPRSSDETYRKRTDFLSEPFLVRFLL